MFSEYFTSHSKIYYTPDYGVTGAKIITYNDYIHANAKIFLVYWIA